MEFSNDAELNQKIKYALVKAEMKESHLATAIGMSKQAFYLRMKSQKFSQSELNAIADALGCKCSITFTVPDGTKF